MPPEDSHAQIQNTAQGTRKLETNQNQARCEDCLPPAKKRKIEFQYATKRFYAASEQAAKAIYQELIFIKDELSAFELLRK